jgi:hypothetical protein
VGVREAEETPCVAACSPRPIPIPIASEACLLPLRAEQHEFTPHCSQSVQIRRSACSRGGCECVTIITVNVLDSRHETVARTALGASLVRIVRPDVLGRLCLECCGPARNSPDRLDCSADPAGRPRWRRQMDCRVGCGPARCVAGIDDVVRRGGYWRRYWNLVWRKGSRSNLAATLELGDGRPAALRGGGEGRPLLCRRASPSFCCRRRRSIVGLNDVRANFEATIQIARCSRG